jgi:hypothetical protein
MENFFKKYGAALKAIGLIFMLIIPFFLYTAAMYGSIFQVKLFLVLMIGTMLFVLKKG